MQRNTNQNETGAMGILQSTFGRRNVAKAARTPAVLFEQVEGRMMMAADAQLLGSEAELDLGTPSLLLPAVQETRAGTHAGGGGGGAGKVQMQDFSFTTLAASYAGGGGGAGKVSMQDFHFVMRNNSASPTLNVTSEETSTAAGTGKVSMQDFHFVMR